MRICWMLLLVLLSQKSLLAQQPSPTENRKMVDQATGNFLYFSQSTDVQGNPFLFDQWLPGILIMKSGNVQQENEIKFEIHTNKFIVNKNDTVFEVSPTVTEVHLYKGRNKTDALIFKNGFTGIHKLKPNAFAQVLASSGGTAFLKVHRKEVDEVTEYNNANKVKRFRGIQEFAISSNGNVQIVKLSKKDLLQLFAAKESEVNKFLTERKLSGRDEKSWVAVFQNLNSF